MNVYTIHIERISLALTTPSLLHRCETEAEARTYAQSVIGRQSDVADLRVAKIEGRPA